MELDIKNKPILNSIFDLEDEVEILLSENITGKLRLTATEEKTLFLQYNYARCRTQLISNKDLTIAKNKAELLFWQNSICKLEDRLIRANMGLVTSAISSLYNLDKDEIKSDCILALLEAIRTFDVERGKFSTWGYANIQLAIKKFITLRGKNKEISCENEHFDSLEAPVADISGIDAIREIVDDNLADLTPDELKVIRMRYFGKSKPNHTAIGTMLGFSREWSRQVEKEGLSKLRKVLKKTM